MFRPSRLLATPLAGLLLAPALLAQTATPAVAAERQAHPQAVALQAFARIAAPPVEESSGLVASRTIAGLYWTHNDSGDGPRLYPLTAAGAAWPGSPAAGILVAGAEAVDWEDLACDDTGHLFIADTGNNANERRDLTVYCLPEPDPTRPVAAGARAMRVAYPDQTAFPPQKLNYDCEALVWFDGKLHLLTKHRADEDTTLYRLDTQAAFPAVNVLTRLGRFPVGGQTTGADVSADGRALAVLTYRTVWVFRREQAGDDFFAGAARWLPIRARQCEAVCFAPGEPVLILSNEQRDLFRLPVAELRPVRP